MIKNAKVVPMIQIMPNIIELGWHQNRIIAW